MSVYTNSERLISNLTSLFDQIKDQGPGATRAVSASRLVIRLRCHNPSAQVVINGRQNPLKITYGEIAIHPDIDVELSADALHKILLAELPLKKAISSGQMKVRGPLLRLLPWKIFFIAARRYTPNWCEKMARMVFWGQEDQRAACERIRPQKPITAPSYPPFCPTYIQARPALD